MENNNYKTDFLFSATSFIIGLGSVMNLSGNYYTFNKSDTIEEADARAIQSDWGVIGMDIVNALKDAPCKLVQPTE